MAKHVYLAVTFWGEEYRRYFLDFCLASLLAPGNIPAIGDKTSARLLIATTDDDWAALQSEPAFRAAQDLISVERVPFALRVYSTDHEKMLVMSEAHRSLTRRMFDDRAIGIFLYPDTVIATGFISRLERLREDGFSAVMFMNVRFANEGLPLEIERRGLVERGRPLALSAKELAQLTITHMHSELKRSGFDNDYDDFGCSSFFWEVVPGEDLLFHCGCWVPLLIDYSSLRAHDDGALECSTLDGDYVANNLTKSDKIYFVRDTSEIFMTSFTPETHVTYSLAPVLHYRYRRVRTVIKILNAHKFLYQQAPMNWLARIHFAEPVRLCGGDAAEWKWRQVERHAANIVKRIEYGDRSAESILRGVLVGRFGPLAVRGIGLGVRLYWVFRDILMYRRSIGFRIGQIIRGHRWAWKRAAWRLRQYGRIIAGKPRIAEPPPGISEA